MARSGVNLNSLFDGLKRQAQGGLLSLGTVLKALETSFPKLSLTERNLLVKDCIRDRVKLDIVSLEALFAKFSKSMTTTPAQAFQQIATSIGTKMGSSS
jgi:hypothetical protein